MAELWFVRHFRTPWNAEGRIQGRRDVALEEPLSDADRRALNDNLLRLKGQEFGAVWCSPLLRARQTAALHGYDAPELRDDLAELNFGPWEGQLWSDMETAHPGGWHNAPHSLTLGEPFDGFADRVRRVADLVAGRDGAPVLVFGHGAWANCLQAISAATSPEAMNQHQTLNGAVLRFGQDGTLIDE
ncbi:MAG: histidine phosphatase family protein [Gemmobacter sp.]|nr:histidine phosphatase family protein [Gemmobacter sp.]